MSHKEQENHLFPVKLGIPICAALPFSMVVLRDEESGNCIAVTDEGECPHAKRRHHLPDKFECRKDTSMKINSKQLQRT